MADSSGAWTFLIVYKQVNDVINIDWSSYPNKLENICGDVARDVIMIGGPEAWRSLMSCTCQETANVTETTQNYLTEWVSEHIPDLDAATKPRISFSGPLQNITTTLLVSSMEIVGDFTPSCHKQSWLQGNVFLHFSHTTFTSTREVVQSRVSVSCDSATIDIQDSLLQGAYLEAHSLTQTAITVTNTQFRTRGESNEPLQGLSVETVNSDAKPLQSSIHLKQCTFVGLGGSPNPDEPAAALSINVKSRVHPT